MSPNQRLIILLILALNLAGLGMVLVFLGAQRRRGRRSRRLTKSPTSSAAWQDFAPVFDDAWPEICFDMDVETTRFAGGVWLFFALFFGLLGGISPNPARDTVVNIILYAIPVVWLILGCMMFLSSLPRWQSRIVLEAERLVVYPTFRRSPRVINYDQICYVRAGSQHFTALTGALIFYYPLDYGGQVDVTRVRQMGLPSTSQNEGLRLVLQARLAGPPSDRDLESEFLSKSMVRPFALYAIFFGIALLTIALQPESRGRVLLVPLGLLEICLVLTVIVIGWPMRRK